MQMIESSVTERGMLPLPSAALVIDIRGVNDDNVMEWLTIEIADLASEMKTYNVHHWRLLTDFISFQRVAPIREDSELIVEDEAENDDLIGPMGRVYQTKTQASLLQTESRNTLPGNNMPSDFLEQKIDELIQEINRVRNNRIAAINDSNHTGIPGQSSQDATVRVIFLVDAKRSDSLTSAALYAEALKDHYRKLNRQGYQEFINTTVLCLGNDGFSGPPTRLINGLMRNNSWAHLDSLILSEDYRDDAALIAGTVQAYLAELLLYVLLIIPPFNVATLETVDNTAVKNKEDGVKELRLPFHTYVVGLAALEYSARWGRRWLNFGLAKEVIDILRQKPTDASKERVRIAAVAEAWFKDWRERVQNTIPDHIPGEVPALDGVRDARKVNEGKGEIFIDSHFHLRIRETTISGLEGYQTTLLNTYSTSANKPTMQDSVLQSTLQVMHVLREKENKSLAERQVTELGKLQVEAEQVLSSSRFFLGATGSVHRAKTQLWALGSAISRFQQEHQNNPLNPLKGKEGLQKKKEAFEESSKNLLDNLKKHMNSLPLFSGVLSLKLGLEILSLILIMALSIIAVLVGFAWLHHAILLNASNFLSLIDNPLLGVPALELAAWIVVLVLFAVELFVLRPVVISKQRSPIKVEVFFWLLLLIFALSGVLVSYTLNSLGIAPNDPTSVQYLAWLSSFPQWAFYAGIFVAVLLIVESCYFFWWLDHLLKERIRIVTLLRERQQNDLTDVTNFIADDLVLEILQRAELTDGKEGLGRYYFRVNQLCDTLDDVADKIQGQQQLAANRLLSSQSETQQGSGSAADGDVWLNLHIRDEMLAMDVVTDVYKDLRQSLVSENEEIRELAEFLVRAEGIEKAEEIGQQLEDRPTKATSEQHQLVLLITNLVAVAMRFAVDPLAVRNIHSVMERYKNMSDATLQQTPALNMLVKTLNKKASQATLQAQAAQHEANDSVSNTIITDAVATWGQIFWQFKDPRLDQALLQDGVLAQLIRIQQKQYDPRAIMRKLLAHTVLFGRSLKNGRGGDVFLLLSPSLQSHRFRQGLKSMRLPRIIDFPDGERILLLGIQRYVAEPLLLIEPKVEPEPEAKHEAEEVDEAVKVVDAVVAQPEPLVDASRSTATNNALVQP